MAPAPWLLALLLVMARAAWTSPCKQQKCWYEMVVCGGNNATGFQKTFSHPCDVTNYNCATGKDPKNVQLCFTEEHKIHFTDSSTLTPMAFWVKWRGASLERHDGDRNSFYRSFSGLIVLAQCFSMFPVQGTKGSGAESLRFRWCSWRVLYSLLLITSALFMSTVTCLQLILTDRGFQDTGGLVFYTNGLVAMALFLRLARRWPELGRVWDGVDRQLANNYGRPPRLRRRVRCLTAVIMTVALVETMMANMMGLFKAVRTGPGWFQFYCENAFPQALLYVPYSAPVGIMLVVVNVVETFSWNFTDLFLMVVSLTLAHHFAQINGRLRRVRGKVIGQHHWRQLREDYNAVSNLTKVVDSHVSPIVLLSFANNLYFICLQLFLSLSLVHDWGIIYFYISFGYLLTRTAAVLFCAAAVNDGSKVAQDVLFCVPSESYNTEVERFLTQVIFDQVALTGLNFFSITRKLILTVVGTIATYEVVVLQLYGKD